MVVCTFYQRGACRFGDQCNKEHPGSQRDANRQTSGGSNNNRFSGFNNNNNGDRYRPNQSNQSNQSSGAFGGGRDSKALPYHLDKDDMKSDLTSQRPIYPLSAYGPGRDAPRQLIEGPVEISPEELRVRYYGCRSAGNEGVAQGEESALNEKMQQQVKAIMNDIDGAIRYVEEGANVHPNRIDIAKGIAPLTSTTPPGGNPTSNSNSSLTQTPAPAPTSTFGQPSRPAFGQTAFGQPSNPGQAAPGFGAPSGLGAKPSPFSTPTLGGNQAFGKPAFGAPGFGTPSLPGAGGGFGQANALGQKPAFGQASAPGTAAPMSQPNALGQASPFGNSAFGQSGFGNPSPLGGGGTPFSTAAASNPSPFGQQPAAQKPPFGQSQNGTFGQGQNQGSTAGASPFASAAKPAQGAPSVFGQPTPPASNASPFATQPASKVSPFGTQPTQTTNPSPFAPRPQQTTSTPSPFGMQQAPVQPVTQMVPQQSTAPASNIDAKERFKEGKPAEYEGEQGSILEEIYTRVGRLGRFNDNELIPDTPPKCEWIAAIPML